MDQNQNTKISNQQLVAKKYIEENEIEKIVSEMLNSLVHEKSKQPLVYMIKYLAGLLNEDERRQHGLVIPDPYPKGRPIVKFPNLDKINPNCLLKKHLTKNVWAQLKYFKTKHDGNIMNIIKLAENSPNDQIGCVLTDATCISTFNGLFGPLMYELHKFEIDKSSTTNNNEQFRPIHEFRNYIENANNDNFPFFERISDRVVNLKFSFSRNLQDMPFTCIMTSEKRSYVENMINKAISSMQSDKLINEGRFINYKDNEQELKEILKDINFDENFIKNAELNKGWPENRQIFITNDKQIIILINFIDHLQIIINYNYDKNQKEENSSNLNSINADNNFVKFNNNSFTLLKTFEKYLNFEYDKFYGYINSYPLLVGGGLEILCEIKLENLINSSEFKNITENMNFDKVEFLNSNLKTKSIFKLHYNSDLEFCEEFYKYISGMINLDRDQDNSEWLKCLKYNLDEKVDPAIKNAYEAVYEEHKMFFAPSGTNLNSLVKIYKEYPKNPFGILFTESSEYKTFQKFLREYILLSQNFDINQFDHIHKPDEHKNFISIKNSNPGKVLSTNICLIRNITGYPFVTSKNNKLSEVNELIKKALDYMNMKNANGRYFPIDSEESKKIILENDLLLFNNEELQNAGLQKDFPNYRGVIHFETDDVFAVINDIDHIKLQMNVKDEKLHSQFMNILKLSNDFSKVLKFNYDKRLGFLTASPKYIGTGMIIKSNLKLNNLNTNLDQIKQLIETTDFNLKIIDEKEGIVEITNRYTIGRSETDMLMNLIFLINEITDKDA